MSDPVTPTATPGRTLMEVARLAAVMISLLIPLLEAF
jgi:hypothetical protein